jgi:hypothetical protein
MRTRLLPILPCVLLFIPLSPAFAQTCAAHTGGSHFTASGINDGSTAGTLSAQNLNGVTNAACFAGADFSAKVNACLIAVTTAGGGICDAREFPAMNYASQTITVGDGKHHVTLLLPTGTVLFAAGKQLIYRSFSEIVGAGNGTYNYYGLPPGSGSIIFCDSKTTAVCVMPYDEHTSIFGGLVKALLANFSVQSAMGAPPAKGSVGLMGGGNGTSVLSSTFENLTSQGFDIGTYIDGPGGCTCYNVFRNVSSYGKSWGVRTLNTSRYASGVNSNNWYGGVMSGSVGLEDAGSSKNHYWGIDIENAKAHGMVLSGYGTTVIAHYLEANGCDLLNGSNNYLEGPMAYGGGAWSPCPESTSTTSFWWGPDATPNTIGLKNGIIFGSKFMNDNGYDSQSILTGAGGPDLDLKYAGMQQTVYGHKGHAGLTVGMLKATAGAILTGKSSFSKLADPRAPKLRATGGTGTTYAYAVIGYDRNGGITMPSSFATVSGPATLDTTHFITITPPVVDGVYCFDILKGDSSHVLPATAKTPYGCPNYNALPSRIDGGQRTLAYKPPSRNTTGDVVIAGQLSSIGSVSTGGTIVAAKHCIGGTSACWTTTAGVPTGVCTNGSLDTDATNGKLYVCEATAWVGK